MRAGVAVESVFAARDADRALIARAVAAGALHYELEDGVIDRVADAVSPQPVLAVVAAVDIPLEALRDATMVLVCVDIGDPGNAGTVLRSAGAAGVDGVVFCHGSVDVYNPKTVRASAGSLFHVPVVVGSEAVTVLERFGDWGLKRFAAVATGGSDYATEDLRGRLALVVGSESHGLPSEVLDRVDERLTIPMASSAESLNVGVAASVLAFEAARQRRVPA